MDDLPLQKIQIPGPTLASLLHRTSAAPADVDGLLFGYVTHTTPTTLTDEDPATATTTSTSTATSAATPTLTATITSFLTSPFPSSFHSSCPPSLPPLPQTLTLIGWFSSRRRSPLRPSLRETLAAHSLSSSIHLSFHPQKPQTGPPLYTLPPSIFLLLTTPFQDQLIHTHDYRAYQYRLSTDIFQPQTLDVINIGPAFRGHYGSFSPNSSLPLLPFELRGSNLMAEDNDGDDERLSSLKRAARDQRELDMHAEGFEIGRLGRLMGSDAANYAGELEGLYGKMLAKLDGLARLVEKSSAKVIEQENHNMKLRYKVARLE
ncbi:hypothetical protein RJ639_037039 [Escallonia herrerae]|uniref:BRCA1-A complex subunit Abraxas n=1 Tax=Escallonia herrerae TaxID=1293975 RepID=A0AA88WS23_9ASTE|nr:hypothetical protein RJ639_037039 [Escallonia herrerae]